MDLGFIELGFCSTPTEIQIYVGIHYILALNSEVPTSDTQAPISSQ